MPRLSIIMPNYNCEGYIENTIRSVLNQTFRDFELIVVDDGSSDHSCDIVESLAVEDSRIRLIKQANDGAPGKARNRGLSEATGELIQYFDSDDLMKPHYLETAIKDMDDNNADIVITQMEAYDERIDKIVLLSKEQFFSQDSFTLMDVFRISPMPNNKLYRKSFLEKGNIKYLEKVFNQDMGYFICNLLYYPSIYVEKKIGIRYMIRDGSITTNIKTKKRHIESLVVLDQIYNEWEKTGYDEYFRFPIEQRLINTITYKATFFDPIKDKDYINQLIDYLNKRLPHFEKSEAFKKTFTFTRRVYLIIFLKWRMFGILGIYKKLKGRLK